MTHICDQERVAKINRGERVNVPFGKLCTQCMLPIESVPDPRLDEIAGLKRERDAARARVEQLEAEVGNLKAAIVEAVDFLSVVADYEVVDVSEVQEFVERVHAMYGREQQP